MNAREIAARIVDDAIADALYRNDSDRWLQRQLTARCGRLTLDTMVRAERRYFRSIWQVRIDKAESILEEAARLGLPRGHEYGLVEGEERDDD